MKKNMVALFLGALSVVSLGESRTAYIMVDSGLSLDSVKVTGIVKESSSSEKQFTQSGILNASADEKITINVAEATEYQSYGGTKYIKLAIDGVEGTDDVKFVLGYPIEGRDIPTYMIIASEDIKTATVDGGSIEDLFNTETRSLEDLVDAGDYTYDTFPGRELSQDTRISGVVVGEQPMEESEQPSNIVDLYSKNGELDDAINKVNGGAAINPTNSNQNSEFELWAIKTDENGDIIPTYDENGDPIYRVNQDGSYALDKDGNPMYEGERVLLFTSKESGDEAPLYGDLRSINNSTPQGELYPGGYSSPFEGHDHYVYDIDVRFKNANGETININNEAVDIGLGTGSDKYKWQFYNLEDVTLSFYGGNNFYFNMKGDAVGIVPPSGSNPDDIPLPVAEEFYAIDDEGGFKERSADITSKYESSEKFRSSNVKMKVMTESGSNEKNYEIEGIKE